MSLSTDLPAVVRPTRVRYIVVAALCIAAAIIYIQRNSYGGADTTITAELKLTTADRGNAASLFFLSYALLQVPSGWLAQRLGPRRTLSCIVAGGSVALALCAAAVSPVTLIDGRLLMGVMQAGIFPCSTLVLASWLPDTQRGTAAALLNSSMLIGGALSSNLTGFLIAPLGWRGLFLVFAAPGLIWAFLFAVWFRNSPADHPGVNNAELDLIEADRSTAEKIAAVSPPANWAALLLSGASTASVCSSFSAPAPIASSTIGSPPICRKAAASTAASPTNSPACRSGPAWSAVSSAASSPITC